jgi:serine/threonine protein kinase
MGRVYRAADHVTGKTVALKIHTASSATSVERFAREAQLLAGMSHAHIVGYIAHGVLGTKQLYVAMEWVDGEDLHHRLASRGLTAAESVRIAIEVASGLDYIHERGILHRDLKPSNVMLVGETAKLIDFGLARRMREDQKLTATGRATGTPGYMAPEQVLGIRELDERVDVFALGCLLYECLTARPAFFGESWLAIQTKILTQAVLPPKAFGVVLPPELEDLLSHMLVKEANARVPNIAAIDMVLRNLPPLDNAIRQSHRGPTQRTRVGAAPWREPAVAELLVVAMVSGVDPQTITPLVAPFGGVVAVLAEGGLVVRVGREGAEPAAMRAARIALALKLHEPKWPISIIDPKRDTAIDEAARQLEANEIAIAFAQEPAIHIDDSTASQLTDEFVVGRDRGGTTLGRA